MKTNDSAWRNLRQFRDSLDVKDSEMRLWRLYCPNIVDNTGDMALTVPAAPHLMVVHHLLILDDLLESVLNLSWICTTSSGLIFASLFSGTWRPAVHCSISKRRSPAHRVILNANLSAIIHINQAPICQYEVESQTWSEENLCNSFINTITATHQSIL